MTDPDRAAGPETPAGILRASRFRREFLEHNRGTRGLEDARALLAAEWRYLEPLLAARARGGPPRVLDLACGSGAQGLAWGERGAAVTGVDFDLDLLEIARERGAPGAGEAPAPRWSCGDATRLPIRSSSVDLVFCNSLLEHVGDWRSVLGEMARVLRPGGVAVVYTTNVHCPFQQEINHFPFYSWLPAGVKRRVLAWIMENRRDLVNYTDFPAINWFSFPAMRREFEAVGLEPLDRIDLLARQAAGGAGGGGGVRGALVRAMHNYPLLKVPYYVYAVSMGLYGVRRAH